MLIVYWKVFKQFYLYDDDGAILGINHEVNCSGRFDEFGSAFGNFVLACGNESTARVYVKVYCDDSDTEGDIVCACSMEWNDIKIGE